MPVYRSGNEVYHTEGSRILWSTTRPPVLLIPGESTTLANFDIAFPDFAKSTCYGLDYQNTEFGSFSNCTTFISVNPQEWDSGLSAPVATLPAGVNHFEIEVELTRIVTPTTYIGKTIAGALEAGQRTWINGGSSEIERMGPIIRMFRFERSGNNICLRRKQSIENAGQVVDWAPDNSQYTGSGGIQRGWTYTGSPNAWPASHRQSITTGNINKRRGDANGCSEQDNTNYASTWRGNIIITPGYIKP